MRTQLTEKLHRITAIATTLDRAIFNEYCKCSGSKRGTYLAALSNALTGRICQVDTIAYAMEYGTLYTRIVAERKERETIALPANYTASTLSIMAKADDTVTQIMAAIRRFVDAGMDANNIINKIQYQFIS